MIIELEQQTIQLPAGTGQKAKRVTTRQDAKTGATGESPYTAKNLDGAIAHLETAIAVDDNIAVFGRRYWRDRVQQIVLTPGIMATQARRLQHLLDQLKDGRQP
jgi:hypothetical protein